MKAFIVDRYGKKSGRLGEMPEPKLLDDDVLVQVHAAGVNPLDSKIRSGEFKLVLPYRLPLILGNEVAGVVLRVGSGVQRFKPGDEVYARPDKDRIGTFAELIAINQADVALKPTTLSMEEAASIPLVALTAWQALVVNAKLKRGAKGSDPRGLRRRWNDRHPTRKASGRTGRDDHKQRERRLGEEPGRRCRDRLQEGRLREEAAGLRHRLEQPRRADAAQVVERTQAPWQAHLDLGPAGSRVRARDGTELGDEAGHAPLEPSNQKGRGTPSRELLVPLYEGQRRPVARDWRPHRCRGHSARGRSCLSVRIHARGSGLR